MKLTSTPTDKAKYFRKKSGLKITTIGKGNLLEL
jgi:hypothetical protein